MSYMMGPCLQLVWGAHFEDSEKKTMSEKEEQKTRQLVQTCVVFRASIGGKKKKDNQTKKTWWCQWCLFGLSLVEETCKIKPII